MNRKSLRDISWQVTEPIYRQDSALSYSILARYEREGFNNLSKLFDKIDTPYLTFGKAVDTLITGTEEDFNKSFIVTKLENTLSDTLLVIVKKLFTNYGEKYTSLSEIPDNNILSVAEDVSWGNNWLSKTKVRKIRESCDEYYKLLYLANGRDIIDLSTYKKVCDTVDTLKSAPSTKYYLEPNNIFEDNIERLYQLKFKYTFDNITYRCMVDELIVIHDKKVVVPIDLKTSSKPEWDFYKSFLEYRYDIQARLYWKIVRAVMDSDPYYREFKLLDFRFITVNPRTLVPLVWEFGHTRSDLKIELANNVELRHPLTIGKELKHYLDDKPVVPDGIDLIKPNKLEDWVK